MKSLKLIILIFLSVAVGGLWFSRVPDSALLSRIETLEKKYQTLQNISPFSVTQTVEKVQDAVVSIVATKDLALYRRLPFYHPFFEDFLFSDPFFGGGFPSYEETYREIEVGAGSGFIFDKRGYLMTNAHVVSDPEARYTVVLFDGSEFSAEVVFRHPYLDIAVVKIDVPDKDFSFLPLGDSDQLKLGETVIAVGNALSEFQNTVTVGVLSGFGRNLENVFGGEDPSLYNLLQTDAAINPGNSGGPLLNLDGEVIGINTAIVAGAQGISFSIPINDVTQSLRNLLED